jgi:hypothetical protein
VEGTDADVRRGESWGGTGVCGFVGVDGVGDDGLRGDDGGLGMDGRRGGVKGGPIGSKLQQLIKLKTKIGITWLRDSSLTFVQHNILLVHYIVGHDHGRRR